jgi:hypothetical protein
VASKIQVRRGTAAQWQSVNPVLSLGEPGTETDTGRFKIGDGVSAWANLPYSNELGPVSLTQLPSGSTITVVKSGSNWPARPTSRSDIVVVWEGADPAPTTGGTGMLAGVDYRVGRSSLTPIVWPNATAFPSTPIAGDTIFHTGLGCSMRYTGTAWRQVDIATATNVTTRNAISTTYASALHAGFQVRRTDNGCTYEWTGSTWWKVSGARAEVLAGLDSAVFVAANNGVDKFGSTTQFTFTTDAAGDVHVNMTCELDWDPVNAAWYWGFDLRNSSGTQLKRVVSNRFHNQGGTGGSTWTPFSTSGVCQVPAAGTYSFAPWMRVDPNSNSILDMLNVTITAWF